MCTVCLEADLDIEKCKWSNPLKQDEGYAPPVKKRTQSHAAASGAYGAWKSNGWVLHCPKGHLLPPESDEREMLIMGLFGESAAGKTAFLKAMVRQLDIEGALEDLGIFGRLAPAFKQTYKDEYLNNNEPTHPVYDAPRKPVIMELTIEGREINLLIFDSSGEEGETDSKAHEQWKFAPVADALLFFAPPATLGDLPESVRQRGGNATQTPEGTRNKFQEVLTVAESNDRSDSPRRKGVLPIFVLSKADQLAHATGFPEGLLSSRRHSGRTVRDIMGDINRETPQLLDFVRMGGGDSLLRKVLSFNGIGRCMTVSGTGTDDGSTGSGSSVRTGASDRCLDALLMVLWERGFLRVVAR
ncbi:hypothetical protein [Arthrobacter sp. efr-133-TYG-118]|uniref:TRAFAC clade GTPase domain-containing protein n=1 Tax=Arthrobacter sp. efr-133-TYG-118 TaxID=3040279 RepID=UPI00254ED034|nr:hypothetical protein [Arthrobacter sp. efr-133-TYG-118]